MGAGKLGRRSRMVAGLCLALSLLAILLWGKLKLVTGAPRTAYAQPGARAPAWRGGAGHPARERTAH